MALWHFYVVYVLCKLQTDCMCDVHVRMPTVVLQQWAVSHCRPPRTKDCAVDKSTKSHWFSLPWVRRKDQRDEEGEEAFLHWMIHRLKPGLSSNLAHLSGYGMLCPSIFKVFIFSSAQHLRIIHSQGFAEKRRVYKLRTHGVDTGTTLILVLVKYVLIAWHWYHLCMYVYDNFVELVCVMQRYLGQTLVFWKNMVRNKA